MNRCRGGSGGRWVVEALAPPWWLTHQSPLSRSHHRICMNEFGGVYVPNPAIDLSRRATRAAQAPPPIIPTAPAPTIIPLFPPTYSTTPAPIRSLHRARPTLNVDRQSASQYALLVYAQ